MKKLLDKVAEAIYIQHNDIVEKHPYPSFKELAGGVQSFWRSQTLAALSVIDFNMFHDTDSSCEEDDCLVCLLNSAKNS